MLDQGWGVWGVVGRRRTIILISASLNNMTYNNGNNNTKLIIAKNNVEKPAKIVIIKNRLKAAHPFGAEGLGGGRGSEGRIQSSSTGGGTGVALVVAVTSLMMVRASFVAWYILSTSSR